MDYSQCPDSGQQNGTFIINTKNTVGGTILGVRTTMIEHAKIKRALNPSTTGALRLRTQLHPDKLSLIKMPFNSRHNDCMWPTRCYCLAIESIAEHCCFSLWLILQETVPDAVSWPSITSQGKKISIKKAKYGLYFTYHLYTTLSWKTQSLTMYSWGPSVYDSTYR